MVYVWMSFAGDNGFLGTVIVKVRDFGIEEVTIISALDKTHILGVNPGGAVLSVVLPEECVPPDDKLDKLLNKDECEELDRQFLLALIGAEGSA